MSRRMKRKQEAKKEEEDVEEEQQADDDDGEVVGEDNNHDMEENIDDGDLGGTLAAESGKVRNEGFLPKVCPANLRFGRS